MPVAATGQNTSGSLEALPAEALDDFVLVEEQDIFDATFTMIEATRNLVEGAAASTLAAALKLGPRLSGKKVALICSGGNITPAQLEQLLRERV